MQNHPSLTRIRQLLRHEDAKEGWNLLAGLVQSKDPKVRERALYEAAMYLESRGEQQRSRALLERLLRTFPQTPLKRYIHHWLEKLDTPKDEEKKAWENALRLLDTEDPEALHSFYHFARDFPRSSLADNALVWAAELARRRNRPDLSRKFIQHVARHYPDSDSMALIRADEEFQGFLEAADEVDAAKNQNSPQSP